MIETGVTLYTLDEGVDSGPIIAKSAPVSISDDDTFAALASKLADVGAELALHTLPDFVAGKVAVQVQNEALVTYTKKFSSQDAFIDPRKLETAKTGDSQDSGSGEAPLAKKILRKINAFNPEPGAWTTAADGKRLKLWSARLRGDAGCERLVVTETQKEGEPRGGATASAEAL